jgi:predicted alpha/beta-hydrolase family hydrolase
MDRFEVETPHGQARVALDADDPKRVVVLGHGAGGGIEAPDLTAAAGVVRDAGLSVALVEQPYRVAGRRAPAPARQLDAAWTAVIDELRKRDLAREALIAGGRSLAARVACRTAEATDATAVLCLAFPLHPPGRGDDPAKSRQPELDAVTVPTLIVQGRSDPFGMPAGGSNRELAVVAGNHGLKTDLDGVAAAIATWLPTVIG